MTCPGCSAELVYCNWQEICPECGWDESMPDTCQVPVIVLRNGMVCEVVQLFRRQESVEDFVNREGVVTTTAVEYRFGLSNEEARRQLTELYRQGLIGCDGRRGCDWGAVKQWRSIKQFA